MKCPSCGYENSDDARYCGLCEKPFGSFVKEPSAPYGLAPSLKPSKEAVKTVKKILRSQSKGPNWFQRHLNWTWVLPQLFLYIAALVVGYSLIMSMAGALMSPLESSFMLPFSGLFVVAIILSLLSAAAIWGIGAWVLKRKDRSMWWLLIFLAPTPAGWLNVFLGFAALLQSGLFFCGWRTATCWRMCRCLLSFPRLPVPLSLLVPYSPVWRLRAWGIGPISTGRNLWQISEKGRGAERLPFFVFKSFSKLS